MGGERYSNFVDLVKGCLIMPKGPAPQPAHLKLLRGNPKHEARRIEIEPELVTAVPEAPVYLVGYAFDEWRRISAECSRLRLLTSVDTQALAAYCQSYAVWRNAVELLNEAAKKDTVMRGLIVESTSRKYSHMTNPLVIIARDAADKMVRYAAEFGLTPAGRARLAAGLPAKQGKFTGFLAS